MHRKSKRILIGIVVSILLLGVIYTLAVVRATTQLRQAYAALENNGRPMQPKDVIPAEIPKTQNAAALYEDAVSLLKEQQVGNENLLEYLGCLSLQFHKKPLSVKRSELKELLNRETVAQALSTIERGTHCPTCRFDRYYANDLAMHPPILEDLWNFVLILGAKARMESEGEEPGNAWDTVKTPLRLISTLVSDPTFECQWLRLTETNYLCEVIQKICEVDRPNARDYEVVEDILNKQANVSLLIHTLDAQRLLIGERLFSMPDDTLYETLQNIKLSGKYYTYLGKDYSPYRNMSRLQFRLATFKPRFIMDHATYLQLMSECVEFLQAPYAPNETNASQEIRSLETSYFFTNRLAPPVRATKIIYCNTATTIHVTRAGLALLQYQERHDRFPEKLDALNLAGLIDPFTLKPLCYRMDDEGFSVYGVGEDLKDNGGLPKQSRQRTGYDIVWRCPGHKNEESRGL